MFIIKSKISPCWHKQAAGDFRPPVPAPTLLETKLPYPNVYLAGPTPLQTQKAPNYPANAMVYHQSIRVLRSFRIAARKKETEQLVSSQSSVPLCPYAYHAMHRLRRVNQ